MTVRKEDVFYAFVKQEAKRCQIEPQYFIGTLMFLISDAACAMEIEKEILKEWFGWTVDSIYRKTSEKV